MMCCSRTLLLPRLIPLFALVTVLVTSLAVGGADWLSTQERFLSYKWQNGSNVEYYRVKKTVSGLFKLCQTEVGGKAFECKPINYTTTYTPDPADSTMAIQYTVVKSSPCFITGMVTLLLAEVFCICSICSKEKTKVWNSVAGITFIMQGLVMMMGCVMYIATFKGETWQKLRPVSSFEPALFSYRYGPYFILLICSFTSSFITGFCAILVSIRSLKLNLMSELSTPTVPGEAGELLPKGYPHHCCPHLPHLGGQCRATVRATAECSEEGVAIYSKEENSSPSLDFSEKFYHDISGGKVCSHVTRCCAHSTCCWCAQCHQRAVTCAHVFPMNDSTKESISKSSIDL